MMRKLLILLIFLFLSSCAPKQAYVSISFDDGWSSIYENAFPILNKYDLPATVFVVTSYIGSEKNFMDWNELLILSRHGKWEIGSHSHTHPDLTTLKKEEIKYELNQSKEILISKGFYPTGFASPYGQFNEAVIDIVRKYYLYHRNAGRPPWYNSIDNIDAFNIHSVTIYYDTSYEEIKFKIDKAIAEKKWLILNFHDIVEGKPKHYQSNVEVLENTAKYLKDSKVKVITISDFLKKHGLLE
ncbi:MAG: polysaccharide deacetylase family protein [Bacteroidetes bacterium]|nr:polysaccharide deacetylase family protein [Bacteroidota bacterium]